MNAFFTSDRKYYRRWINIVFVLLIPASAHFLAGRRRAGRAWLALYFVFWITSLILLFHPKSPYAIRQEGPLPIISAAFWLIQSIDACRYPIRRFGIKKWAIFPLVWICFGGVILLMRQFVMQPFAVPTRSMEPTILGVRTDNRGRRIEGDGILVDKMAYRWSSPKRGDLVVFTTNGIAFPNMLRNNYYVKRVVGIPGDTVGVSPPYVSVNGNPLKDPEIFSKISEKRDGYDGYELTVPSLSIHAILATTEDHIRLRSDEYLVFGDNSHNSLDGRYFGPIKRDAIIGKAVFIYAPAERKGRIQ